MTFIAPARLQAAPVRFFAAPRPSPRVLARRRILGEDGARVALGGDHGPRDALLAGAAVEHLARIALG